MRKTSPRAAILQDT